MNGFIKPMALNSGIGLVTSGGSVLSGPNVILRLLNQ